jgi:hypothetical protein
MNGATGFKSRTDLEEYLQDLICGASTAGEVGVLIETLMAVQARGPLNERANAKAAEA